VAAWWQSGATFIGNTISGNSARYDGGGVCGGETLVNNIIADNQAGDRGAGLYVGESAQLLHNTIARNRGGDGSGVYVPANYSVVLTNTILVSHTVGIRVRDGGSATLEATMWGTGIWANETDWAGDGTIITGTVNLWGNPAFVDPGAGDYHLESGSAATDTGVQAGVSDDIDDEPRPIGPGYDMGADEAGVVVSKEAIPNPVQPGAPLTYTLLVTNVAHIDLHATIADILPDHVTTTLPLVWTPVIPASGGVWERTFVVTVDEGYAGPLVNRVEVTTTEGAKGKAGVTVNAGWYVYLPLILRQSP
jgi:hypothetical protein